VLSTDARAQFEERPKTGTIIGRAGRVSRFVSRGGLRRADIHPGFSCSRDIRERRFDNLSAEPLQNANGFNYCIGYLGFGGRDVILIDSDADALHASI